MWVGWEAAHSPWVEAAHSPEGSELSTLAPWEAAHSPWEAGEEEAARSRLAIELDWEVDSARSAIQRSNHTARLHQYWGIDPS